MAYPTLRPTSRTYAPGDWANKTFNAISGAEVRIRYGDKRYGAKLTLSYQNVRDTEAQQFLLHYDSTYGTQRSFSLPTAVLTGWSGASYLPSTAQMAFRYEGPPEVQSVRPGISSVSVTLIGVI